VEEVIPERSRKTLDGWRGKGGLVLLGPRGKKDTLCEREYEKDSNLHRGQKKQGFPESRRKEKERLTNETDRKKDVTL